MTKQNAKQNVQNAANVRPALRGQKLNLIARIGERSGEWKLYLMDYDATFRLRNIEDGINLLNNLNISYDYYSSDISENKLFFFRLSEEEKE